MVRALWLARVARREGGTTNGARGGREQLLHWAEVDSGRCRSRAHSHQSTMGIIFKVSPASPPTPGPSPRTDPPPPPPPPSSPPDPRLTPPLSSQLVASSAALAGAGLYLAPDLAQQQLANATGRPTPSSSSSSTSSPRPADPESVRARVSPLPSSSPSISSPTAPQTDADPVHLRSSRCTTRPRNRPSSSPPSRPSRTRSPSPARTPRWASPAPPTPPTTCARPSSATSATPSVRPLPPPPPPPRPSPPDPPPSRAQSPSSRSSRTRTSSTPTASSASLSSGTSCASCRSLPADPPLPLPLSQRRRRDPRRLDRRPQPCVPPPLTPLRAFTDASPALSLHLFPPPARPSPDPPRRHPPPPLAPAPLPPRLDGLLPPQLVGQGRAPPRPLGRLEARPGARKRRARQGKGRGQGQGVKGPASASHNEAGARLSLCSARTTTTRPRRIEPSRNLSSVLRSLSAFRKHLEPFQTASSRPRAHLRAICTCERALVGRRARLRRGGRAHGPRPSQVGALARLALSFSLSARALDAFRRQHVPADKDTTHAPSRLVRDPELVGPDAADRATEPACELLQREAEGTRGLASASLIE